MTNDLRVGVVGAGLMGADHIARITQRIAGAVVSAVVEPDQGRATGRGRERPGRQSFARIEDAIAAGAVDAVLIAMPGQFHEPVLVPALEAGLPILCEKPLTPDSTSSWAILELRAEARQSRTSRSASCDGSTPSTRALRDLVASGDAGRAADAPRRSPQPVGARQLHADDADHRLGRARVRCRAVGRRLPDQDRRGQVPAAQLARARRLREPILVLMELENGVLVDVEMNVSVQFGYQVATEAVFERASPASDSPRACRLA